jgi:hypothetical protein
MVSLPATLSLARRAGVGVKILMAHGEIDCVTIYPNISSFLKGHLMKKERSARLRWSWLRKIINIAFGLAVFSITAKPVLAQETVFGPEDLKIGWFHIHFSFHKFTVHDPGEGTIIIGKNTPGKKIGGGIARLNGKWIPLLHFPTSLSRWRRPCF